ncbi:hypothetical protein SAMN05216559_2606 [Halomicrobium zhouii]|uniref:Uncharacterized protein n=1 Tax=Halomicrobium zhouii TaxID=767519 RepID=A0A1I6LFB7_9EURY|nr:hypothetical protein [Halomicrobium zhouii]SFS02159.1 hypothetical protein SAMN05216559_2606 [Halomicrobium zhouii]
MPDSSRTTDRRDAPTSTTRRTYLQAAGALGAVSLMGSALVDDSMRSDGVPRVADGAESDRREDFLWMHGTALDHDRLRANGYAFARRHDLAVVLAVRSANWESRERTVRRAMTEATAAGLDVWLRVGMLTELAADEFVADADARRAHLDRLAAVCGVYDDLTDAGRVVLWEEAPVMGQWVEGGAWTDAAVDNLLEHGPRIFADQKRVVSEATTDRDVGIFVHFPYVVDSKNPEVFRTLTDRIADRGATPDFAFLDFYRGWYEKDVGPGPADDAVRSLVGNASDALGGSPVFYLGQAHTVNPNHTPSKQSLRSNLRASLEAGAAGLGWYGRSRYAPTEQGFDPFVPNEPDVDVDEPVTTGTVARDRLQYAWLSTHSTRSGFDPADRFDLWLRGDAFSFYDRRVRAKDRDGWTFLRDVDGYVDGEYPYGGGPDGNVAVVRGLRRDRWLDGGALALRIESGTDAEETTLRDALAMPCDPDAYVAEHEAASLLAGDAPVERFALGASNERASLVPGDTRQLSVPIERAEPPSLHGLRHPDSLDAIRDLQSAERREGFDRRNHFDLWLHGTGLSEGGSLPGIEDGTGTPKSPADVSATAVGTDPVALCYGLRRDRFLDDGLSLSGSHDAGTDVDAAYAMPYAGSETFRTASRAAELLDEQPREVATYSLDAVDLQ